MMRIATNRTLRVVRVPSHVMLKSIVSLGNLSCSRCFCLEKARLYPNAVSCFSCRPRPALH